MQAKSLIKSFQLPNRITLAAFAAVAGITFNKFIVIQNSAFSGGVFEFFKTPNVLYPTIIIPSLVLLLLTHKPQIKIGELLVFCVLGFYNVYFFMAAIMWMCLQSVSLKHLKKIRKFLTTLMFFQVALGILQLALGKTLGLQVLGESTLTMETPGASTISFLGVDLLRAYGSFAHPNILGAFVALSLTSFRSKFLILSTFSLNASLAQIFSPRLSYKNLLFPFLVLLIKNPWTNPNTFTQRTQQLTSSFDPIEYQPIHNVFLELYSESFVMVLAFLGLIYLINKKDRNLAFSILCLASFDHFLISHPQGIMLLGLVPLLSRSESN